MLEMLSYINHDLNTYKLKSALWSNFYFNMSSSILRCHVQGETNSYDGVAMDTVNVNE